MTLQPLTRIGSTEGAMVKVFKRAVAFGAGVLIAGGVAGCSGSADEEEAQQQPETQANTVAIDSPKDASSVDLCSLLPAETATSLGLEPEGEVDDGPSLSSDSPEMCTWKTPDGSDGVKLGPIEGRSIQEYYENKQSFVDYEETTIAGHPAVRANEGDPAQDGFCAMYAATTDRQLLYAHTSDSSRTDPCGMAQKALEASVPTLPAAAG